MDYVIVTVKDARTEAFQAISCVRAKGEAMRNFMNAVNNPQNELIHNHPEDFDLYVMGFFNDETGEIVSVKPELLIRGIDAKRNHEPKKA